MPESFLPPLAKQATLQSDLPLLRDGLLASAGGGSQRGAGGRGTSRKPARTLARSAGPAHPTLHSKQREIKKEASRAPHRRVAPVPQTMLDRRDLRMGVSSCIDRGLIPTDFDAGEALAGPPGQHAVSAAPAPLHKHVEQFKRQEIMTTDLALAQLSHFKLDVRSVEQMSAERPPSDPVVDRVRESSPEPVAADKDKEREDTRTYAELLDVYSLHEFIIRKGKALRTTPEFTSYQRSFAGRWGAILSIVGQLEELLTRFGVPLAYIDGKKVATLAAIDLGPASREELLGCIANRDDVEPLMVSAAQEFLQGRRGHDAAARRIQAVARMFLQRRAYRHLRAATVAARHIQRYWAVHRGHMRTRQMVQVVKDALMQRWRQTQAHFTRDWPRLREARRVVVHCPSLSYAGEQCATIPMYQQQQRAQLTRLLDLQDDNVDVIIMSPIKYEEETINYYYSMLSANGVRDPAARVMVLVPETIDRLPKSLSLAKAALCSTRLLKVLASLVKGKVAYLVPGVVGNEEQLLAAKLNIPMLAPEAQIALGFGTKSGAKAIFDGADVATPVGAHRIATEADLVAAAARFVAEYPEYPRWIVKLDKEFGGRGLALLDVRRLRCLEENQGDPARLAAAVQRELSESAAKRFKIVTSHLYGDWAAFVGAVEQQTCVIEAVPADVLSCPVCHVCIEADGTPLLQSMQQQVFSPSYVCTGVTHPHGTVASDALKDAALSVATAAHRRGILGHATVDFVVFRKAGSTAVRLWAVDLKLHLTNNAAIHPFAAMAAGAAHDQATATAMVRSRRMDQSASLSASGATSDTPLHYTYSGVMHHPYISALRHGVFFSLCRQRGFTFDSQLRSGVLFHLIDTLLSNCLGVLVIASTPAQCAQQLLLVLDFVQQQLAAAHASADEGAANVHHIVNAARNVAQRHAEKKDRTRRG